MELYEDTPVFKLTEKHGGPRGGDRQIVPGEGGRRPGEHVRRRALQPRVVCRIALVLVLGVRLSVWGLGCVAKVIGFRV